MIKLSEKIGKFNNTMKVGYFAQLNCKQTTPVILSLKPLICNNDLIKIHWAIVEQPQHQFTRQ